MILVISLSIQFKDSKNRKTRSQSFLLLKLKSLNLIIAFPQFSIEILMRFVSSKKDLFEIEMELNRYFWYQLLLDQKNIENIYLLQYDSKWWELFFWWSILQRNTSHEYSINREYVFCKSGERVAGISFSTRELIIF